MRGLFTALLMATLLMAGPVFAAEKWVVSNGSDKTKIYTLPAGYELNRVAYAVRDEVFMLGLKSPQGAQQFYTVAGGANAGAWTNDAPDRTKFMTMPPYGQLMNMNSRLLRATAPQNFDQPFGDYKASILVSENKYTKKASRSGRYGPTIYEQTVGRGKAIFKITDAEKSTVFSFYEDYDANSGDYALLWTPDGRYVVMIPPKASLKAAPVILIAGPFPVRYADRVAQVNLRNADAEKEALEDERLSRGEMTADQRYSFVYDIAIRRLMDCKDLLNNLGRPDKISLTNPLHALFFGEDQDILGMRYRLQFIAGNKSGELEMATPLLRTATGRKSSLSDYFTVVTINANEEKTDVFCPF